MNQAKFDKEHRGLSAIAKKVFDATPLAQAWSVMAIGSEMRRIGSCGIESRTTLGCLNTLIDAGLVVEVTKGNFKRVEVRTPEPSKVSPIQQLKEDQPMIANAIEIEKSESTPIDRLSSFAMRLRALADDMENTALDLADKAEKNEAETAKMRQLQALLKSLG